MRPRLVSFFALVTFSLSSPSQGNDKKGFLSRLKGSDSKSSSSSSSKKSGNGVFKKVMEATYVGTGVVRETIGSRLSPEARTGVEVANVVSGVVVGAANEEEAQRTLAAQQQNLANREQQYRGRSPEEREEYAEQERSEFEDFAEENQEQYERFNYEGFDEGEVANSIEVLRQKVFLAIEAAKFHQKKEAELREKNPELAAKHFDDAEFFSQKAIRLNQSIFFYEALVAQGNAFSREQKSVARDVISSRTVDLYSFVE